MTNRNDALARATESAAQALSEEDLLATARTLVETSADLIGENAGLTRRVAQHNIALAALARGLEALSEKLDGELKSEALALLAIARQD